MASVLWLEGLALGLVGAMDCQHSWHILPLNRHMPGPGTDTLNTRFIATARLECPKGSRGCELGGRYAFGACKWDGVDESSFRCPAALQIPATGTKRRLALARLGLFCGFREPTSATCMVIWLVELEIRLLASRTL